MRIINGKKLEETLTAQGRTVVNYAEIAGLSTETKPTAGLGTGSLFFEVDTGDWYVFEEGCGEWMKQDSDLTSLSGATVTLGSALTYTGEELTQAVSSVVLGTTTLTANTDYKIKQNKATEPGSYTLYVVGIGNYTGVAAKAFTVAKASGSVTASPDTLSLTEGGDAGTSTLTIVGDGAVTLESSDTDVATAVLTEDENTVTVTVTPVAAGSATVTLTQAASTHYTGGTETISVTVAAAAEEENEG